MVRVAFNSWAKFCKVSCPSPVFISSLFPCHFKHGGWWNCFSPSLCLDISQLIRVNRWRILVMQCVLGSPYRLQKPSTSLCICWEKDNRRQELHIASDSAILFLSNWIDLNADAFNSRITFGTCEMRFFNLDVALLGRFNTVRIEKKTVSTFLGQCWKDASYKTSKHEHVTDRCFTFSNWF